MAEKDLVSKYPKEIMEFISVFTQGWRYLDGIQYLENVKQKGGAVTMCAVADALISEGIRKGRLEGKIKSLSNELFCSRNSKKTWHFLGTGKNLFTALNPALLGISAN